LNNKVIGSAIKNTLTLKIKIFCIPKSMSFG